MVEGDDEVVQGGREDTGEIWSETLRGGWQWAYQEEEEPGPGHLERPTTHAHTHCKPVRCGLLRAGGV